MNIRTAADMRTIYKVRNLRVDERAGAVRLDTGNVPLGLYDERGRRSHEFYAPIYHCVRRLVLRLWL